MAETTSSPLGRPERSLLDGWHLDAIVTVLSVLMVLGIALDFRAHANGISFAEEGFLTPEHAFFYTMFLGIAAAIGARTIRDRRGGASWIDAVPAGYGVGVLGVLLFGFGGVGDFLWHSAFGFEESTEALISPTHLMLAVGAGLFLSSPARATWRRSDVTGGLRTLPAVVAGGLVLTIAVFFTGYVNPLMRFYAGIDASTALSLGIASFIVFSAILVGTMVTFARRFDLPPGGYTLLVLLPGIGSVIPFGAFAFLVPVLAMGITADALAHLVPPKPSRPWSLRLFGAAVPVAFAATYMATFAVRIGIDWRIHAWAGAIVYAGLAGLLVTYLVRPTARWDGE